MRRLSPVWAVARTLVLSLAAATVAAAPAAATATTAPLGIQHDHPAGGDPASDVGAVDFRVSCDPEVREDFDRAVALLHNMMYQESRRAFEEIAGRDPQCAMAHWGIATTLFQPLWPARPDAEGQLAYNARAAEVLAEVYEREPRHPGAIHYTIHADDATTRASENLRIVDAYAEIAPEVPHALHMPTHIYVRLGRWPEVIEWNRRSAAAALERLAGERVSLHHIHALDYLLYAHLQRGDDQAAAAVLHEQLARDAQYQEDPASAFHLAVMPARYAFERRAWEEAARITPREPSYLAWERYLWPEALSWFARGMGAAHTGDLATVREAEARMAELRQRAEDAGEQRTARYIEVDRLILSGRIARAEGGDDLAVERTRQAAELEQTVEKHPITPGALLPPYEALGDLLMELERPDEALAAYEASLEIWPGRYHSLLGAARAAREAGDETRARQHYAALLEVVEGAGSDRPGVREAEAAARSTTASSPAEGR